MENINIRIYCEFLFPEFLVFGERVDGKIREQINSLKSGCFWKSLMDWRNLKDLESFVRILKDECEDNEETCVFDYFLYVDGLSFASCQCLGKKLEIFTLPVKIDLSTFKDHEDFKSNKKFYKYSFKGFDMTDLLRTSCEFCSNDSLTKSFEIFQDSIKILTFSITGVYKKNIERLKILKSFPDDLKIDQLSFKRFKLYSLLFEKEGKMVVLSHNTFWMKQNTKVNFLTELHSLLDEKFDLRYVSYHSTNDDFPIVPSLSSRSWRSLLFEYYEKPSPLKNFKILSDPYYDQSLSESHLQPSRESDNI